MRALTKRKIMGEQLHSESDSGDNHQSIPDLAPDQQRFEEWLSAVRTTDDVRNRIAVAGRTISQGEFGKLYLLAPDREPVIATSAGDQSLQGQAGNDREYEQQPKRCER